MTAKRSSRALALLLTLPSAAFALGLGDIRLLSPLNAPLEAEIDLVDVTPEEMSTVQAQLASRDTFARYGLDWPAYLSGVQVKTVKTGDGREVIRLKSNDPISDPFVTLLVEVNWARGKLVREYTMLLDPPVFTPGQSQVASALVSAPGDENARKEGSKTSMDARSAGPVPVPVLAPVPHSAARQTTSLPDVRVRRCTPGRPLVPASRRSTTDGAAISAPRVHAPRIRSAIPATATSVPAELRKNRATR